MDGTLGPDEGIRIEQQIVGFHQDGRGDWVAELACGHAQHVRHDPPWQLRPWVLTGEGRATRLGTTLYCRQCLSPQPRAPQQR